MFVPRLNFVNGRFPGAITRAGSGDWLRLGFIVPWQEPEIKYSHHKAPVFSHRRCEAARSGLPCQIHPEPEPEPEPEKPRYNRLRYPLFGREIDYGRNQWEYHAWDPQNEVAIPVGTKNSWALQNGDLVQLLGDTGLWAAVLTELY